MACKREITLDDFAGRRRRLGLDLASTVDVDALAMLFRDGDRYIDVQPVLPARGHGRARRAPSITRPGAARAG